MTGQSGWLLGDCQWVGMVQWTGISGAESWIGAIPHREGRLAARSSSVVGSNSDVSEGRRSAGTSGARLSAVQRRRGDPPARQLLVDVGKHIPPGIGI